MVFRWSFVLHDFSLHQHCHTESAFQNTSVLWIGQGELHKVPIDGLSVPTESMSFDASARQNTDQSSPLNITNFNVIFNEYLIEVKNPLLPSFVMPTTIFSEFCIILCSLIKCKSLIVAKILKLC